MYAGITFPQIAKIAATNLEGLKYRLVAPTAAVNNIDVAAAANIALGVLTNDPRTGEHASVDWLGTVKVQVGTGGLGLNQWFTGAASGFAVGVSSGAAATRVYGRSLGPTTVASGGIARVLWNPTITISGQAL